MASKRKRAIVTLERPIIPTKERQAKPDFEEASDGKYIKADIVSKLRKKNKISSEVEASIVAWIRDYNFSEFNYSDPSHEILEQGKEIAKGDIATRLIQRAEAGERIKIVRMTMGSFYHERLKMILIEGMSFTAIGKVIFPERKGNSVGYEVSIICETLLNLLHPVYQKACLEQKNLHKRERDFHDMGVPCGISKVLPRQKFPREAF